MEHLPIRLLALDLDGTALNDEKRISPRTAAALTEALARGVVVIPATGRTVSGIAPDFLALPGVRYALVSNGARVEDLAAGVSIVRQYLPTALALRAYDRLACYDCTIDLFQDGKGYTTTRNLAAFDHLVPPNLLPYLRASRTPVEDLRGLIAAQPDGVEKLTLFFRHEDERLRAWAEMEALGLAPVSSLPHNMELNAPGVDKGTGLLALAAALGIPPEATMACGDGGNDTAMLRAAGVGVAMANAFDEVKAVADYITASNNEDGVALAVEKFILGRA